MHYHTTLTPAHYYCLHHPRSLPILFHLHFSSSFFFYLLRLRRHFIHHNSACIDIDIDIHTYIHACIHTYIHRGHHGIATFRLSLTLRLIHCRLTISQVPPWLGHNLRPPSLPPPCSKASPRPRPILIFSPSPRPSPFLSVKPPRCVVLTHSKRSFLFTENSQQTTIHLAGISGRRHHTHLALALALRITHMKYATASTRSTRSLQ